MTRNQRMSVSVQQVESKKWKWMIYHFLWWSERFFFWDSLREEAAWNATNKKPESYRSYGKRQNKQGEWNFTLVYIITRLCPCIWSSSLQLKTLLLMTLLHLISHLIHTKIHILQHRIQSMQFIIQWNRNSSLNLFWMHFIFVVNEKNMKLKNIYFSVQRKRKQKIIDKAKKRNIKKYHSSKMSSWAFVFILFLVCASSLLFDFTNAHWISRFFFIFTVANRPNFE